MNSEHFLVSNSNGREHLLDEDDTIDELIAMLASDAISDERDEAEGFALELLQRARKHDDERPGATIHVRRPGKYTISLRCGEAVASASVADRSSAGWASSTAHNAPTKEQS